MSPRPNLNLTLRESGFEVLHYWLTWARPEDVLAQRELFGEWVLVTALHSAPSELLSQGPPASPERRALARRRWRPRKSKHSLQECLQGIRRALHPQVRLVWILLLIENHRYHAITELIHLIGSVQPSSSSYSELASAAAWGLAQLGRDALFELRERFKQAPVTVQEFFCQALWHMGLQARGCEQWLGDYDSAWARAVLYRLETYGWKQLLERRAWPLWLDGQSLPALANLAFSLNPHDRFYALRAMAGWGPAFPQVEGLLRVLAGDPDLALGEAARLLAEYLSAVPGAPTTLELARILQAEENSIRTITSDFRTRPTIQEQASLLWAFYEVPTSMQLEILDSIRAYGIEDHQTSAKLQKIIEFPHTTPIRVAAVHAYAKVATNPTVLRNTFRYDSKPEVRQAAAEHLVKIVSPEFVLKHLDQPEILHALRLEPHLLRALVEWPEPQFRLLVNRLKELGNEEMLDQLDLDAIQWAQFERFTPVQNSVAFALIRYHRKLPTLLVEEVAQGRLASPTLLEFWVDYPPENHRDRGLAQMLVRLPSHQRLYARLAASDHGEGVARALAELVGDPDPVIATRAAEELANWPQAGEQSWGSADSNQL